MAKRWRGWLAIAALAPFAAGCLLKDRIDTWYLEPNGAVTWSVVEKDVRSDAKAPVDRQNEETTYLTAVRAQTPPIAMAFQQLTPAKIETRILRGSVPFTVVTDCRFSSVAVLAQRIIDRAGLAGASVLNRDADGMSWTMTFRDPHAENAVGDQTDDEDLEALVDGLDGLKVVLVEGRFTSAAGFDLSSDGRVATIVSDKEMTEKFDNGAPIVIRLSWK
jgi:hypothetical protein